MGTRLVGSMDVRGIFLTMSVTNQPVHPAASHRRITQLAQPRGIVAQSRRRQKDRLHAGGGAGGRPICVRIDLLTFCRSKHSLGETTMKRRIPWAAALLLLALPVQADIINVPGDYPTIQEAVDNAGPGDQVVVAAGTYGDVTHLPGDGDTTRCAVVMASGITVKGAGPGETILDAELLGRGFHCGDVTDVTIRDMTIRRSFAELYGAGIYCKDGSDVDIINVIVEDCEDGGIISRGSSTVIANCIARNNLAKQGGGISIESGSTTAILNSEVTGNSSPSGGGMFLRGSQADIENCLFSGNFITALNGAGGGAAIVSSTAEIVDTDFLNNTAGGTGGGIAVLEESVLNLSNAVVHGNETTASYGPGGGLFVDFSEVHLQEVTITRNTVNGSGSDGGGLYVFFAEPVTLVQCTVAANDLVDSPDLGSGISVSFASPTIEKSIIAFNTGGTGIYCGDQSDDPVISCTDVYGNEDGDDLCGTDGGDNFSLDPLFCDLAGDNYRLQFDSPCFPGNHPDGGMYTCDRDRLGAQDPGCDPAGVHDGAAVAVTRILSNHPNPFTPSTTIRFELAAPARATLAVYDVAGRRVRTLLDRPLAAGPQQVVWDGRDASGAASPSGIYYTRLTVDGTEKTRRMVLAR
ncbi:MAG: T9SS type A sorting domain-containing protein [Candidatus Eisenbacteria bacterium]|nr:T9SS type A sorting domain-containing protein [Candidatus Latescibacterota bacterium]MBD3302474.1 T9SS type A sorting domain-containing protein [Candidatus Eisenbacteria bacterium]